MKLLIPLYDLSYAPAVISATLRGSGPRCPAVIVNVHDGPGRVKDKEWVKVISSLHGEVFGYIDLKSWVGKKGTTRPRKDIAEDCRRTKEFYGIDRYFFDDHDSPGYNLPNPKRSIANPGTNSLTECGTTMVFESENYLKSAKAKALSQAVLAMAQPDFRPAMDLAKSRGVKYFYSTTEKDNWKAYDRLPSYFDEMVTASLLE